MDTKLDAIQLLEHDHRMVEQLFRDFDAAASDEQQRGVVEVLIRELSKHAALEELLVYPLVKKTLPDGEQEVGQHLAEHMEVKKLLVALDKLDAGDPKNRELMDQLHPALVEHIAEEEGDMFTRLREHVGEQDLQELGEVLDAAKSLAPTRAHPHAPEEPPGLVLAGPLAAAFDRIRDRIQGRPLT